jgi:hypothetical protein
MSTRDRATDEQWELIEWLLECGAILDALLTLSLLPEAAHSKAKILLVRIASMLSILSRPVP